MVQGATYTLTVKPAVSLGIVREIVFTVTDHGSVKATKTYPAEAYLTDEGNIAVPLTQEDTADLNGVTWLEAQYIFTDGAVGKTVRKMLFFRKSAYTKMASAEDGETDAENTGVFALDMEDPVVVVVKTVEGGGTSEAVKYTPQTLTEEQQMQARENLDLYRTTREPNKIAQYGPEATGTVWELTPGFDYDLSNIIVEIWDRLPEQLRWRGTLARQGSRYSEGGGTAWFYWWGNLALINNTETDTGEPIVIYTRYNENVDDSETWKLKISESIEPSHWIGVAVKVYDTDYIYVTHPVPSEYFPETVLQSTSSFDEDTQAVFRGVIGAAGKTEVEKKADKADIPKVFGWANAELPFAADRISDTASGAGFVTNPANFEDGKTYFRYHAGSASFTWTNPNPQVGAVTITVLAWNQYSPTNTFASRLNIIYSDGTTMVFAPTGGTVSTYTTDASKTLTAIKGNYDLENWVLLDMSVMSIVADYDAPYVTKTEFESALGSYIEDIDVLIGGDA